MRLAITDGTLLPARRAALWQKVKIKAQLKRGAKDERPVRYITVSSCCHAPLHIAGHGDTHWHECQQCRAACDPVSIPFSAAVSSRRATE